MACVVFPHTGWSYFPYRKILQSLRAFGPISFVTDDEASAESYPEGVASLSPDRLTSIAEPKLAIITHPYWLEKAAALHPGRFVFLLPERTFEAQSAWWTRCLLLGVGVADLFGAESEAVYLEQSFKNDAALLLRDPDALPGKVSNDAAVGEVGRRESDYGGEFRHSAAAESAGKGMQREAVGRKTEREWETLLRQALVRLLADGIPPSWAVVVQRQSWLRHYADIRETVGAHETVSFLLSVYSYLLGEFGADEYLREAFLHAAACGREDCLRTHYRFLSAILARNGELDEAVDAFGVTALTEEDKDRYARLCLDLEQGKQLLAKARLLRWNDDLAGAIALLDQADDPEAVRVRRRALIECGRWEEAHATIIPEDSAGVSLADSRDTLLLEGAVRKLRGDRHGAIRSFLAAAELDRDALEHIAGMKSEAAALDRLREELRREAVSGIAGEKGGSTVGPQ
ncbi:tetratricopeptide repeat protein [Cohnella soli]|uniref:Tetratricopeptide repeat protein n=1 Tax=Cohnella soli TaxID=425005 RepID=A0ABW0HSK3_9BACL